MVQCKSCGRTIGEEYIYCSYCGKDTPKMEMIKKTECNKKDGYQALRYPGFVNRIRYDFNQHYLLLLMASFITIIILLCPMFQITRTEVNQGSSTKYYTTSNLLTCLKDNYMLNGEEGVLPEEMKLYGTLLVCMNVASILLVVFFTFRLLFHKDNIQTYSFGRIALNTASISLMLAFLLYVFMSAAIYGNQNYLEGIETASTRLNLLFYLSVMIVLFTRFRLLSDCTNRISHWRYLTR